MLITNGVTADLSSLASDVKSAFTDGTWALTSFGGKTYAIPQDVGPMMLYYRSDLFEQFGLTVPKTWDEFAAVAEQVRAKDSKRYLADLLVRRSGLVRRTGRAVRGQLVGERQRHLDGLDQRRADEEAREVLG